MFKLLKILLFTLVVLVVLLIGGAVIATHVVDPNDFKQPLSDYVKEKTGRHLAIAGDIKWRLYPWLGLSVKDVSLSNPKGFANTDFAKVKQASFDIKVLPLLWGAKEIDHLKLKGLNLSLHRPKTGQANWDLGQPAKPSGVQQQSPKAKKVRFHVDAVTVEDASISWQDDIKRQKIILQNTNLSAENVGWGQSFPLNLSLDFDDQNEKIKGSISLKGTFRLDEAMTRLSAKPFALMVKAQGKGLAYGPIDLDVNTGLFVDLTEQTFRLDDLSARLNQLSINGDITGSQIMSAPRYQGTLNIPETNLHAMLKNWGVKLTHPNAFKKFKASTQFDVGADRLILDELNVTLDESIIRGVARIQGKQKLAGDFKLTIDKLNLDHYAQEDAKVKTKVIEVPLPPFEILRKLSVNGSLTVGQLILSNINMRNIQVNVAANDGIVNFKPISTLAYGGTINGDVKLSVKNSQAQWQVNEKVKKLQLQSFLKDWKGIGNLSGTINTDSFVTAQGQRSDQMMQSLNGNTFFSIEQAAIKGLDLAFWWEAGKRFLRDKRPPTRISQGETRFSQISGSFKYINGVAHTDDLVMIHPEFHVKGQGEIDLVKERINMRLWIQSTTQTADGKTVFAKDGLPLVVVGSLDAPVVSLDPTQLHKVIIQEVQKTVEQEATKAIKRTLNIPGAGSGPGLFRDLLR